MVLPDGLLLAFSTFLGLAAGSFINVCSDRLPRGVSVVSPPSACDSCHRRLGIKDLVPLFSYLWRRGHCGYCGAPIPRRVPVVEAAMGLLFPLLFWHFGLSLEFGFSLVSASLLAIILVIDIEHQLILNRVVYPAMAIALVFSPFYTVLGAGYGQRLLNSVAGGAVGLAIMLFFFFLSRGGMGLGDVRMAALLGLMTGFPKVFVALFLAIVSGGLVAAVLLAIGIKKRRQPIPFGPFLAIGTMAVIVWGEEILHLWHRQFSA